MSKLAENPPLVRRDGADANRRPYWNTARRDRITGFLFLAPAALVVLALVAVPLVTVVTQSFTDASFLSPITLFIGLENYSDILGDASSWLVIGRTLLWTAVSVAAQIVIGLALAMLLNVRIPGRGFLRALFLLPWVTPVVVVALIWQWMLNDLYGVVNHLLGMLNPEWGATAWFSDPSLALGTVIAANIWRGVPFTMIIFLAGLQSVPKELVEAARVDGAGAFRTFTSVTLPHLRGILITVAMIFTMFNFNNFDLIYLTTQGGPAGQTTTLPVETYLQAFKGLQIGRADAWAVLTLITIVIIAVIYFTSTRRSRGVK